MFTKKRKLGLLFENQPLQFIIFNSKQEKNHMIISRDAEKHLKKI